MTKYCKQDKLGGAIGIYVETSPNVFTSLGTMLPEVYEIFKLGVMHMGASLYDEDTKQYIVGSVDKLIDG